MFYFEFLIIVLLAYFNCKSWNWYDVCFSIQDFISWYWGIKGNKHIRVSHLLDWKTLNLNFLQAWQKGAVFMMTQQFINLVEVLKGLQEDLMAAIFVPHQADMRYRWHTFVATHDNAHMWFATSIYANNHQSKQVSWILLASALVNMSPLVITSRESN